MGEWWWTQWTHREKHQMYLNTILHLEQKTISKWCRHSHNYNMRAWIISCSGLKQVSKSMNNIYQWCKQWKGMANIRISSSSSSMRCHRQMIWIQKWLTRYTSRIQRQMIQILIENQMTSLIICLNSMWTCNTSFITKIKSKNK
jgi:hypothetical protein